MTDVQDGTTAAATSRQRPPAGVLVIAVLCMLEAGVLAVAALLVLTAPGEWEASGIPRDVRRALVGVAIGSLLPATLFGAAGFNLWRRRNWSRRVTIVLLLLQAFGQIRSLFGSQGVTSVMNLVLLVLSVAGVVYLSRANVKRAFTSRGGAGQHHWTDPGARVNEQHESSDPEAGAGETIDVARLRPAHHLLERQPECRFSCELHIGC